jgi:hypothetical protein
MGVGVERSRRTDPVALERKVKGILGAWAAGDPYVIAKAEPNSPEEAKQRPMPPPGWLVNPARHLLGFKASLTGDEKDYVLDYKKRNPRFPHETTSDQFFTEEQFEAYRALGFHVVEHFFDQGGDFGFLAAREGAFSGRREAREAIDLALPALRRPR